MISPCYRYLKQKLGSFELIPLIYERADFRLPAPNVVIFLRNPRITRNLPSSGLFFFFFFFRSRIQCHTGARVVDLPNAGGAPEYRNQAGQTRMLDKWPETCEVLYIVFVMVSTIGKISTIPFHQAKINRVKLKTQQISKQRKPADSIAGNVAVALGVVCGLFFPKLKKSLSMPGHGSK